MAEDHLQGNEKISLQRAAGSDVASISERKRNRLQALELRQSISMSIKPATAAMAISTAASGASSAVSVSRITISRSSPSPLRPPRHPEHNSRTAHKSPKPLNADFEGPTYTPLTKLVLEGPIASQLQLSTGDNSNTVIDSMIRELVQDNGKAVRDIDGILGVKIQDRVLLLDNPAGQGKAVERARKRAKKLLSKRSNEHYSKRQHKQIGSYDLPSVYHRFDLFLPMHEIWKAYAIRSLNENRRKASELWLLELDLHGAFLAVVQAKVDNQVGVEGIMIRETSDTYAIVTKNDKIKVIQKPGSVFVFRLGDMLITWFGDRAARRQS